MARSVKPWVGKTDDTAIPPRVRLRVFAKAGERCTICTRKINAATEVWTCEHVIALINWWASADAPHGNIEANLGVTCSNCLPAKNAADVAEKSAVAKVKKKHTLPKTGRAEKRTGFRKLPKGYRWDWSGRGGRAVKA